MHSHTTCLTYCQNDKLTKHGYNVFIFSTIINHVLYSEAQGFYSAANHPVLCPPCQAESPIRFLPSYTAETLSGSGTQDVLVACMTGYNGRKTPLIFPDIEDI